MNHAAYIKLKARLLDDPYVLRRTKDDFTEALGCKK